MTPHHDDTNQATIKERAKAKLSRDLGALIIDALNDPKTVEVMLNADGNVWQEKLGEPMCCIGTLSAHRAEAAIKTIAGYHGKEVTRMKPILEGEFPLDGSRFAGQLPPVVPALQHSLSAKKQSRYSLYINMSKPTS